MMLQWPWAKLEWRAVCAERCTYGSGRRSAYALLTPLWTAEGWLYLAIVLDFYSRRIVGWATSDRLKKDLALNALRHAIALRQPSPGLIHHTDRGSQYCSHDYQRLLKAHGIIPSMSGKGNCFDNAMVETVFKTIKNELIWRTSFQTRKAAELALGRYIDGFYNPRRRHSALGYKSPAAFEANMAITE
jgi:transposase InsO family protein